MAKLFLLDAYALIYRSYYAFLKSPRINSKGLNTSAVMGFCNTLNEVLTKEKPTHIGVAFDHGKTFRHEAFPDYKAQREETPEDIRQSVPIIKQILEAMHIPILQADGFEADDVIGTVATRFGADGIDTFMLTPDKDYGQLIDNNIFQLKPGKSGGNDELIGIKEICEKYGIQNPSQVVEILTICGDSADNVPGVNGIGEKGAQKLIDEFGSVENVYANIDKLFTAFVTNNFDNTLSTWGFLTRVSYDMTPNAYPIWMNDYLYANAVSQLPSWVEFIMAKAPDVFKNNAAIKDFYEKFQRAQKEMNGMELPTQETMPNNSNIAPPTPAEMAGDTTIAK